MDIAGRIRQQRAGEEHLVIGGRISSCAISSLALPD